jgi:ABC-type lipoprotein release transport system permease subunit
MKPLSPLTYYRRHKRQALLLVSLIAFTTLWVYVTIAVVDSTTLMHAEISYLKQVSVISPRRDSTLEPGVVARVQSHPDVACVIPENGRTIRQPGLFSPYFVALLGIPETDLPYLIEHYGLRIKEGRLLQPRTNEIMLSAEVVRALGLRLGDQISAEADPRVYEDIPTPLALVGILESDPAVAPEPHARLGFASYEYFESHELYMSRTVGLLVVAAPGRRQVVSEFLEAEIASSYIEVDTYEDIYRLYTIDWQGVVAAFGFINCVVAIGAAFIVGIVNQIAISQRLSELGMLNALGHNKERLIRRLALETVVVAGVSWVLGLALAFVVLAWMKSGLYYARGLELDLLNLSPLAFVAPVPLIVVFMSIIAIVRAFARFDAVEIVERGRLSLEAQQRYRRARPSRGDSALSIWTFYLRHRRRGAMLFVSTTLAILIIVFPVFVATTTIDAAKPSLEYLRYVSEVWPRRAPALDTGVAAQIRSHPAVARAMPVIALDMEIAIPLGDRVSANVFGLQEQDLSYLVDLMGRRMKEGRLPRAHSNEIVVAEPIALNRGLRVGDTIALPYRIVEEESVLANERVDMVIVGILAGPARARDVWLSLASYEFMERHAVTAGRAAGLLVAPVAGRKAELDTWLEHTISSPQTHTVTFAASFDQIAEELRTITLIFVSTEVGIAVVAAIAVAIMNYISFSQRREEFGVLNALGRGRAWLVLRTAAETGAVVGSAWLISAVIYGISLLAIQIAVFTPKGIGLDLLNPTPWFFTLPVPLAIVLASVWTIAQTLRKLDSVAVIERL